MTNLLLFTLSEMFFNSLFSHLKWQEASYSANSFFIHRAKIIRLHLFLQIRNSDLTKPYRCKCKTKNGFKETKMFKKKELGKYKQDKLTLLRMIAVYFIQNLAKRQTTDRHDTTAFQSHSKNGCWLFSHSCTQRPEDKICSQLSSPRHWTCKSLSNIYF